MNIPKYIQICDKLCQTYRGIEDKWRYETKLDEVSGEEIFELYCGDELVFEALNFNKNETENIKNMLSIFTQRLIKKASDL